MITQAIVKIEDTMKECKPREIVMYIYACRSVRSLDVNICIGATKICVSLASERRVNQTCRYHKRIALSNQQ